MLAGTTVWESFLSFLTFGIHSQKYTCSLGLRILMVEDCPRMVFILHIQLIGASFRALSFCGLGKEHGNLGLQIKYNFLCSWQQMIDAGQLIALLKEDCLTQKHGLIVVKRKKPSAIFHYPVFWLENFGLDCCNNLVCSRPLLHIQQKRPSMTCGRKFQEGINAQIKRLKKNNAQTKQGINSFAILGARITWWISYD